MVRNARLFPLGLNWRRFIVAATGEGGNDEHITGCVQIKPHDDGSRELASLVVAPPCRQQGLGSRLVRHAQRKAGPPLWLMCRSSLATYYRQFGFQTVARADEMPPYFRRIFKATRLFYRLLRRDTALAIMVWVTPEP